MLQLSKFVVGLASLLGDAAGALSERQVHTADI